jgi:3-oxoacyl-[acyl-carrier-protein] synthase-3
MEGKEVFRRAVRVMIDSAARTFERAGVDPSEVALVVPHQANIRIIQAACSKLGIPLDRTSLVIDRIGNNSSASIPIALVDAIDAGRVSPGDLVLLVGFGAGMTWASALLRWMPEAA